MPVPTDLILIVDPNPPGEPDGGGSAPVIEEPPADGGDDLAKLRGALQKERERARAEESARKQLEAQLREVGTVDPKLLDDARQRAREAEQQRQLIEQQTTIRLQEQQRKFEELLEKKTSELQALASAAQRDALRVKTEREFLAAKGLADASSIDGRTPFDYIWQLYGSQFSEDRSGLFLVDSEGMPRLDEETGKRITPAEFFARLRKDPVHGMHFQPEYGSGSGSRGGRDGRVNSSEDLSKVPTSQLFRQSFGPRSRTA